MVCNFVTNKLLFFTLMLNLNSQSDSQTVSCFCTGDQRLVPAEPPRLAALVRLTRVPVPHVQLFYRTNAAYAQ